MIFEKKEGIDYEVEKIEDKLIDIIVLISQISNKLTIIIESIHKLNDYRRVIEQNTESR
jgi:hypothetical protein